MKPCIGFVLASVCDFFTEKRNAAAVRRVRWRKNEDRQLQCLARECVEKTRSEGVHHRGTALLRLAVPLW
jgi:RNA-binding protein YhbY